jgi:hypothetical protein
MLRKYLSRGEPLVWFTGSALGVCLLMIAACCWWCWSTGWASSGPRRSCS